MSRVMNEGMSQRTSPSMDSMCRLPSRLSSGPSSSSYTRLSDRRPAVHKGGTTCTAGAYCHHLAGAHTMPSMRDALCTRCAD